MTDNRPPAQSDMRLGGLQGYLDRLFVRIADFSGKHPLVVFAITLLFIAAGVYGASQVRLDNSMDAYFHETDETFANYQDYINTFQSDETVYLLYAAPESPHGPFDLDLMTRIASLTEALEEEVPFVRKVTSLSNVELIESDAAAIDIHDLLEDFPETQEELLAQRPLVLSKPLYVGALIDENAQYGAVVVETTKTSTHPVEELRHDPERGDATDNLYPQATMLAIRKILEREEYLDIQFWVSGDVPINTEYNTVVPAESGNLAALSLLMVMGLGLLFIRSRLLALFGTVAVVVVSLIVTIGLMGAAGWKINLFFLMAPTLLCAVGVAQCMHLLLARQQAMENGQSPKAAIAEAIRRVGTPCLMAAVTTAIGFLGMAVSDLRAVAELAMYSAFGVVAAFFLSITLLASFAAASKATAPGSIRQTPSRLTTLLKRCANFNIKYRNALLVVFAILMAVTAAGLSQLRVDFNFLEEFQSTSEIRIQTEKVNDTMGGIVSLVYVFETEEDNGAVRPEVVQAIETAQTLAMQQSIVLDSQSMADFVKEINQAVNDGDSAYYRIPDDEVTLAQLLFLYDAFNGEELGDVLNYEKSQAALQLRLKMVSASEVRELLAVMDQHFAANPVPGVTIRTSGIGRLWVQMADYITSTQLQGYTLVFLLILLVMIIGFGSIRVGLLGMIPNLFPIVLALGFMGWIGWHLDYLRLLLATIAIGIAVDDTIHMLAALRSSFANTGNYAESVRQATAKVGPAIIATTTILCLAFSSYLISSMAILNSFGILLMGTIFAALIADLFLLPALVLWLKPFGKEFFPERAA